MYIETNKRVSPFVTHVSRVYPHRLLGLGSWRWLRLRRILIRLVRVHHDLVAQGATILNVQPFAQADAVEEVATPRDLGGIHFLQNDS